MTAPPDPPAAGAQPHSHLLLNRVITTVLRSALHPLLSRNLALLTYRGRRTGRAYTIPVSYQRDGGQVTVFSNQRWWRNLRGGARVELRLRGKRVPGRAEVHEDGPTVVAAVRDYLARKGPGAGRTINLRLPDGGIPDDRVLTEATRSHVVVRITLEAAEPHGVLIRWARGYDPLVRIAFAGREQRVRAELLDRLALRPGDRVLDIACGTGTLAVSAAARVGPAGWVGALDASPEMVQAAREKAVRAGVNVDVREGLAQALPFPDDSMDAVVSTLAWHHIPPDSHGTAASEMTRVLRPGGRLLIADLQAPANPLTRGLATHLLGHRMAGHGTAAVAQLLATAGLVEQRRGTTSARWLAFITARKPAPDVAATRAG